MAVGLYSLDQKVASKVSVSGSGPNCSIRAISTISVENETGLNKTFFHIQAKILLNFYSAKKLFHSQPFLSHQSFEKRLTLKSSYPSSGKKIFNVVLLLWGGKKSNYIFWAAAILEGNKSHSCYELGVEWRVKTRTGIIKTNDLKSTTETQTDHMKKPLKFKPVL